MAAVGSRKGGGGGGKEVEEERRRKRKGGGEGGGIGKEEEEKPFEEAEAVELIINEETEIPQHRIHEIISQKKNLENAQ